MAALVGRGKPCQTGSVESIQLQARWEEPTPASSATGAPPGQSRANGGPHVMMAGGTA